MGARGGRVLRRLALPRLGLLWLVLLRLVLLGLRCGRWRKLILGLRLAINIGGWRILLVRRLGSGWRRRWLIRGLCLIRYPGREAIHARLTSLLHIGDIGVPRIGGKYYFYTRRDGLQNQPVLYVREGIDGKDRVLVDVNLLAADGTVALDWFEPAVHGKYVAYGTSSSGSEMSTLHIIETKTGNLLPDTIGQTRAASIAWMPNNSGFYYTRYPKKGDVPEGQEQYNRRVFFHELGTDPESDQKIFGEGRDAEDWPEVRLDNDGRMLLITVSQGWTKTELFLMDLKKGTPPTRITTGKNFLYSASVYNGRVYIVTNEDAPRFRMFVTEAG